MKQVKKMLYLLGVLIGIVLLVFIGTGVAQAVISKLPIAISEDLLYHVSGGVGIAIAGILCAIFVKKRNYVQNIGKTEQFSLKKLICYMGLSVCICQIITDAVITLIFSNLFPVVEEQVLKKTTYMDIAFAVILAPVVEELLFRMGVYCLLRKKFGRISSSIICAFVFAIMHGYQIQGFLSCLVAGFVFTLIYDNTRNIFYCIGAHMICNLFVTLMNELEYREVTWFGIALQYEVNGYVMSHPIFIVMAVLFCMTILGKRISKGRCDVILQESKER